MHTAYYCICMLTISALRSNCELLAFENQGSARHAIVSFIDVASRYRDYHY